MVPWHWMGAGWGGAGPEHYTTELLWHKYCPHGQVQATNSLTTSLPSPWSLNNRLLQAGTNQLQHNTEKHTVENMKYNPGPSITGLSTESLTTSSNVCLILCWRAARESKSVYPRLPMCVHWRINLPIVGSWTWEPLHIWRQSSRTLRCFFSMLSKYPQIIQSPPFTSKVKLCPPINWT